MADIRAIVGPMRCGKSEHQISIIRRMRIAGKKTMVLKPYIDTRTNNTIASRLWQNDEPIVSSSEEAITINQNDKNRLLALIGMTMPDAIFADECQFFEPWFVDIVFFAAKVMDIPVYLSGLDLDAWRDPFGIMPALLAIADVNEKMTAVCNKCKSFEGRYTHKLSGSPLRIDPGDQDYEPRCYRCHVKPGTQTP